MTIHRGEIFIANLSPTIGSEINKTRPVLIVSNNYNNRSAETVTILPISSNTDKIYPFEVFLPQMEGNLETDSKAKANQIRTIDKLRLKKYLGQISSEKMKEVEKALLFHLAID